MFQFLSVILVILILGIIPIVHAQNVPDWVKNTAGWWATDAISEQEFVNAIEFLIKSGVIYIPNFNCISSEDNNANNIPDEIELTPNLLGMNYEEMISVLDSTSFKDKNWSNCKMPLELSSYSFTNIDFSNADFSNSNLINTLFTNSTFDNANFSNSILHGVTFLESNFDNTNFSNADFSINSWESPYVTFTYKSAGVSFYCSFLPCTFHVLPVPNETNNLFNSTFGEKNFPLNLHQVDTIIDESDTRTIWRLVPNFTFSILENIDFSNADFSHGILAGSNLKNIDFNNADTSNVIIYSSELENVDLENVPNGLISIVLPEKKYNFIQDIHKEKFVNNYNIELDIEFLTAIDHTLINWAMGMLIHDDKLYIADTDNHRILVYDKNTLNSDEFDSIISPKQNFCDGVNAFTPETYSGIAEDCSDDLRNIPTSLAIINDKIFTAYGMQHEIQIFDKNGKYVTSFGIKGNNDGEFNFPYRIFSSNNQLFVADSGNQRIQIFDTDGNFLKKISTNVNSITNSFPSDVIVSDNQIFVFESNNSSVLIFDMDGNFLRSFQVNTNIPKNSLVGFDIHEELVFISASDNDKVLIVDINGNNVMSFGKSGTKYGEFNFPLDIIVDGSQLYVSDAKNYRIQVFSIVK